MEKIAQTNTPKLVPQMPIPENGSCDIAPACIAENTVEGPIYVIRNQKVMLENDVARLYEVETRTLLRAVRSNSEHFPVDFMFRLTPEEFAVLQAQPQIREHYLRNRSTPFAFTEAGVVMVSQVLNSARALQVNVTIIRDFVRLRRLCGDNLQLADKLDMMDAKYDTQTKKILAAIEALQGQLKPSDKRIGFYVS